jgi:hypothetical protein
MKARPAQEVLGLRFDGLSSAAHVALALSLAALWLLGRRYGGFTHDASIYVLQGLRVLEPSSFAKDLFFLHGSQDAYTIFPRIYALLIDAFGAGIAAVMVTIAGQITFIAAAAALVFRIAAGPVRWWCLALLAVVSGYYGGVGVFRLAEPFATARTLSEPLVLAALAFTLASRHRSSAAALIAALALHPLVAAPGIASVFLWHAVERPRMLWWIPLLAVLVPAAGILWPGFTLRFDPPWLAAVLERTPHLFISQWLLPDWSRLLWGFSVAWLAWRVVGTPVRRLVLVVAGVGLAGVIASWIAVDLLDNAFAAGLQLWRAHWLLHFLAIVLAPVAVAALWRAGNAARLASACVAASFCFGRAELPASASLAAMAVVLEAANRRWPAWMGGRTLRLALVAVLCTAAVGALFEIQSRLPSTYGALRQTGWTDYLHAAASVGGLLPLAALLWLAACSRFSFIAAGAAAGALAVSLAAWDAREPWPRFIEQASAGTNPFREVLPPGAQVYWPGPYGKAWLALGRPSWISADQGAGIVFNRHTAIEYVERRRVSKDLLSAVDNCANAKQEQCRIAPQFARGLCARREGPDYLVLNASVDGYAAIEWPLPPAIGPGRRSLFLYDCRAFGK